MQTLHFTIRIHATPEKVWDSLWEPENYKAWTRFFSEGSYYKTSNFAEGNTIHFLLPSGDGMYSLIEKLIENKLLTFRHLGTVKDFQELPADAETMAWTNGLESYELKAVADGTELTVKADTTEEYIDFMNKTFPLALEEVKRLSEYNNH